MIIIGTVESKNQNGTRNLSRDPLDPTKESPNDQLVSQEYAVVVGQRLYGQSTDVINVVYGDYSITNGHTFKYPDAALDVGSSYVLFLQEGESGTYYGALDPWQFRLQSGKVIPVSSCDVIRIKEMTEEDLLQTIINMTRGSEDSLVTGS